MQMLRELRDKQLNFTKRQQDGEDFHDTEQNAKLNADEHDLRRKSTYI